MEEIKPEQWLDITMGNGTHFLYFYTPLCGTCQLVSKMLQVINETIPNLQLYKCNLNYFPDIAIKYEIESVPCLIIWKNGEIAKKIYAFQSVHYLYDIVKSYNE